MGENKIRVIKVIHTIIWFIFNVVIFTLFTLAYFETFDILFWTCIFIILVECVVLLINNMECPLTTIARKYSDSKKANFDIYLPEIIARYNKEFYATLMILFVLFLLFRHFIL